MTRIAGFFSAFAVVLVIVLVNGGYVYKTTCQQPNGSTTTGWEYRINDVVPYFGFSQSGCTAHTATREVLSAIGLWKLKSGTSRGDTANAHAAALELRTDKTRSDRLDRQVLAIRPSQPLTRASLRAYGVAIAPYVAKYARLAGAIQSDLSRLDPTVNPDVRKALSLLERRNALTATGFSSLSTDLASDDRAKIVTDVRAASRKVHAIDAQFNALISRIDRSGGA